MAMMSNIAVYLYFDENDDEQKKIKRAKCIDQKPGPE